MDIAEDLLRRQHAQSARAANLIGNRHLDEGRSAAALPQNKGALSLPLVFGPDEFAVSHKKIGLVLLRLGDDVLHSFSHAIELHDGNFEVWRGFGLVLL